MTQRQIVEVAPGRFRLVGEERPPARSALPLPYVISDETPPTEHVDGKFYTSKAAFRAVTRAHGLTEVGTEKFKPKQRASSDPQVKRERDAALKTAMEKYKAGYRVRSR